MRTIKLRKEDIYRGNLILINKDHSIGIEENEIKNDLVPVCSTTHLLKSEAAKRIHHILKKIDTHNEIVAVSCFRTKREQEEIYNRSIKENGLEFTKKYVAKPDESEHQSGLAIDLGEDKEDMDFICPDFPYHGVFNEFRKMAVKNGFIERYKEDKEFITGISKEPWHFRYIGYPHSVIMEEKGFCLEEYHVFLKKFTSEENSFQYKDDEYIWKIFYVEAVEDIEDLKISEGYECNISGNNKDGFIITQYQCSDQ